MRVSNLPARSLSNSQILLKAMLIVSSPELIQPYPLSRSPAARTSEKSNTISSTASFIANSLPAALAHASALSPILRVHTVLPLDAVDTQARFSGQPLSSPSTFWERMVVTVTALAKPLSVPTTGSKPTPQPCRSNHIASTTSCTVSMRPKEQLNCEASRVLETLVPPNHSVRPDVVALRVTIRSRRSSSSCVCSALSSAPCARSQSQRW